MKIEPIPNTSVMFVVSVVMVSVLHAGGAVEAGTSEDRDRSAYDAYRTGKQTTARNYDYRSGSKVRGELQQQ